MRHICTHPEVPVITARGMTRTPLRYEPSTMSILPVHRGLPPVEWINRPGAHGVQAALDDDWGALDGNWGASNDDSDDDAQGASPRLSAMIQVQIRAIDAILALRADANANAGATWGEVIAVPAGAVAVALVPRSRL
jgi:hypothetical protein